MYPIHAISSHAGLLSRDPVDFIMHTVPHHQTSMLLLCHMQIGIILSSLGVLTLSAFDFLEIVELLNIVYRLAELMEFAAFIYLRYKAPSLYR